jgi:hypothetical protein
MWLSEKLTALLELNVDQTRELRTENAVLKSENDTLKRQLAVAQTNFDWLRLRVNSLELERVGLMERAYQIKLPAPEIVRTQRDLTNSAFQLADLFESLPLDETPDILAK